MGKGSKQRPTDHKKYSSNFDAIFGKKDKKETKKKPPNSTNK